MGLRDGSSISIKVQAYAGVSIGDACDDIIGLANRTLCNVHCDFNGVTLIARPGDSARRLEKAWETLDRVRQVAAQLAEQAAQEKP